MQNRVATVPVVLEELLRIPSARVMIYELIPVFVLPLTNILRTLELPYSKTECLLYASPFYFDVLISIQGMVMDCNLICI